MLDSIQAYPINFIQKASSKENDAFDFCWIYSFYTEPTDGCQRLKYIIRAEAHDDVFAIKFYAARDKGLDDKYNRIMGVHSYKGALRIFLTCASLIPVLSQKFPDASYIVNGARTINHLKKVEDENETQRFRIYRALALKIIGKQHFKHYQFKEISSYLLVKRKPGVEVEEEKQRIKSIFMDRYDIEDVG